MARTTYRMRGGGGRRGFGGFRRRRFRRFGGRRPSYRRGASARRYTPANTEFKCCDMDFFTAAFPVPTFGDNFFVDPSAALGTSGGVNASVINLCALGTDIDQRIGRKVITKSIEIDAIITPATDFTIFDPNSEWQGGGITPGPNSNKLIPAPEIVTMFLVYDQNPNGVYPAVSDIWQDISGTSVLPFVITPRNLDNRSRFRTLWRKSYQLMGSTPSINGPGYAGPGINAGTNVQLTQTRGNTIIVRKYLRCNIPTVYNQIGVTATIGSCQLGCVYFIVMGTMPFRPATVGGAGATTFMHPAVVQANIRIRNVDM